MFEILFILPYVSHTHVLTYHYSTLLMSISFVVIESNGRASTVDKCEYTLTIPLYIYEMGLYSIHIFGNTDPKNGAQFEIELPEPIDAKSLYGNVVLRAKSQSKGFINYTHDMWYNDYKILIGNDLGETTKEGYVKDGFIIDDSDSEYYDTDGYDEDTYSEDSDSECNGSNSGF